ncbi:UDP-3-O-(3-hydroxymyristoyl)glucosamine N-acyltransferase [Parafilimonas sp.]|uniref:UDP-3-O-(3-hydroxymyristoyl)glucosamine N-acyltransferase n=1 Tax=Parafilimonas sp. TaxID=1969739 RepID=UPI0039E46783
MKINAERIAQFIEGKVEGNGNAEVASFGKIEEAKEGQLAFLANPRYEEFLYTTKASVVLLNDNYELKQPVAATLIRVPDAYIAFAKLLQVYQELMKSQLTGIQQPSYIDGSAQLGEDVFVGVFTYIGANAVIGNNVKLYPGVYVGNDVKIDDNAILHPGVKIYFGCCIGKNVTIHAGTVIGGDGFGFAPQEDGGYKKVPQIGNVVIEDNVEIGCNAAIDRATVGSTIIHSGTKLDNLIQIAHNVEVGCNTVIAAQAGVSGSTKIGRNAMIGGQVGIVGHLQIADGTKINAQSGVSKSIKEKNTAVTGSPAYDYTSALRSQALTRNLPQMEKRLAELEKLVRQLMQEKINF